MRDLDKIATTLFDKIRTRFPSVSIGDQEANSTTDQAKVDFSTLILLSIDKTLVTSQSACLIPH